MTWKEGNYARKFAQLVVIQRSRMCHEISTSAQILSQRVQALRLMHCFDGAIPSQTNYMTSDEALNLLMNL